MNWGHVVHQRGRSDKDYHRDACIATKCRAMKCQKKKKTSDTISMHETLFFCCFKTWIEKLVFLELIRLYLKKLTPKNAITSIDLCPCHASRNLVLATNIQTYPKSWTGLWTLDSGLWTLDFSSQTFTPLPEKKLYISPHKTSLPPKKNSFLQIKNSTSSDF